MDKAPEPPKKIIRRKGVMDFSPSRKVQVKQVPPRVSDEELARREAARIQVNRREEIHRQIEAQNEADILAHRRAEAARKELARQRATEEEAARARAEKEAERAELMQKERLRARQQELAARAEAERRRELVARRRAEAAKRELARRQAADARLKKPVEKAPKIPVGSVDPIARQVTIKMDEETHRVYGGVTHSERIITRAEQDYRALHPETLGDIDDFANEVAELDSPESEEPKAVIANSEDITDIDELEERLETLEESSREDAPEEELLEEDSSANNYRYVLGGRSPFINTDHIEKRPLSGDNAGIAVMEHKFEQKFPSVAKKSEKFEKSEHPGHVKGATESKSSAESKASAESKTSGHRYVPYEEPIPHKTLYARRVEAAKKEKADVPTMVVADGDKSSGATLAVVVLLTIILGAVVGVVAYLAFFQ